MSRLSVRYGSHLLVLLQAAFKTYGPILELGCGVFSTSLLHQICLLEKRQLVSVENDKQVYTWAKKRYSSEALYHRELHLVSNWDDAPIDRPWDVVLVDHSPSERRVVDIERLANLAQYLVVHDTDRGFNRRYRYDKVFPLFRYQLKWDAVSPHTTVLSNFRPLDTFWERAWPRTVEFH
jgi:hypothetical protein